MYKYKDIENKKSFIINDNKVILEPRYIINTGDIYYDSNDHFGCIINLFVMNLINDILRNNKLDNINTYLLHINSNDIEYNNSLYELEYQIYNKLNKLVLLSENPKEAINSLLSEINYLNKNNIFDSPGRFCDVIVSYLETDKIYPVLSNKTIITAKDNIYQIYFNYIIMGYNILKCPKLSYDGERFNWINTIEHYNIKEEELKEEAGLIKKYISPSEIYKYFK